MKIIAIPSKKEKVCDHLLQCDHFVIDTIEFGQIINEEKYAVPEEYRNIEKIALILKEKKVEIVLAGKMDYNEADTLYNHRIEAVCYCSGNVNEAVSLFLKGML